MLVMPRLIIGAKLRPNRLALERYSVKGSETYDRGHSNHIFRGGTMLGLLFWNSHYNFMTGLNGTGDHIIARIVVHIFLF
jgi:hypothetical protein